MKNTKKKNGLRRAGYRSDLGDEEVRKRGEGVIATCLLLLSTLPFVVDVLDG